MSNGRPALIDYWESPLGSQFEAQWARLGLSPIGRAGDFRVLSIGISALGERIQG